MDNLIGISEAARIKNVTTSSIYRWAELGKIDFQKIGSIRFVIDNDKFKNCNLSNKGAKNKEKRAL